ncbi:MAG: AMP-binding protein [Pseudomonadota bacterium]
MVNATAPEAHARGYAVQGEKRVPIEVLEQRGARLAAALAAGGVRENDCVAIMMRNDFGFLEGLVATALLGVYAVPINWHQKGDEVGFILNDSHVTALLVHADMIDEIRAHVPPHTRLVSVATPPEIARAYSIPEPDCRVLPGDEDYEVLLAAHDPFTSTAPAGTRGSVIYTSGTTGRPKGVRREPLHGEQGARFGRLTEEWWGLHPGVSTVMAGPMYHSAPNVYAKAVLRSGGSISLMPRFEAEDLLRTIEAERITHMHLVPTMFIRLLRLPAEVRSRYDLSSIEFVVHGAAPCPPEVKRAMIDWWGEVIYEYYGATEMGMITRSSSQEWLQRPGTVGKAWPGREVRIYNDDGKILGAGEVGEIYATLAVVPQFTYQNAPEERAKIERDGMITNGDVGYLDEDGYLYLVDRKKDMVISGGVNIYPAEIECALALHPGVADSAVIGIPDDEFGEKVAALVLAREGEMLVEAELAAFLRARLANFKVPRVFMFVQELPRDDNGKLMKRKLRDTFWVGRSRQI